MGKLPGDQPVYSFNEGLCNKLRLVQGPSHAQVYYSQK